MKKFFGKILLITMTLCLLFCSAIIPVWANDEIYVDNWDYLRQLLTNLDDDEEITIVVTRNLVAESDETIEIDADDCTINLIAYSYCEIYPESSGERFLEIEGENIEINISEHLCIACFSVSGDGGAIYVDDEGFELNGGYFRDCHAGTDGGAICVDDDCCVINDVFFQRCSAGDDGGAIYRCYDDSDFLVINCEFSDCTAKDEGNAVDGFDDDTTVQNCRSNSPSDFENCKVFSSGSTLSSGDAIIVAVISVISVAVIVLLIILKKKKKINV